MIIKLSVPVDGIDTLITQYDIVSLVFTENLTQEVLEFIDISSKEEISTLVLLSGNKPITVKTPPSTLILNLPDESFSEFIFTGKYEIRFVTGFGDEGKGTARRFTQMTKGSTFIHNNEVYRNIIKNISKSVLLKTNDGLGDMIMLTPIAKAWYKRGYTVDILTIPERKGVLEGLYFINQMLYDEKEVNFKGYKKVYDISGKISNYKFDYCKQHRVFTMANLCGLLNSEVERDMIPELPIINSGEDFEWVRDYMKNLNNPIILTLDSIHTSHRSLPKEKQQELINRLVELSFTPILLFTRKVSNMKNCCNLTGCINKEKFLQFIYQSKNIITIDTSTIHVAAAYGKRAIVISSLIEPNWRVYPNNLTEVIRPKLDCFPCNESSTGENCFSNGLKDHPKCVSQVNIEEICKLLIKPIE